VTRRRTDGVVEGKERGKGRAGLGARAAERIGGGGGGGEKVALVIIAVVVAGANTSLGGKRAGTRGVDTTIAAVTVGAAASRNRHGQWFTPAVAADKLHR